jgi:glycosyltransferase involved in cell wall biosynthesis
VSVRPGERVARQLPGAQLPPRIGLNAIFLEPGMGGLDTYVQELVPQLVELAPRVRFELYCSALGQAHLRGLPWTSDVELVTHPLLGRRGLRALSELTLLGRLASKRVGLLHSVALTAPLATKAVNVVTIADVTWLLRAPVNASERLWRAVVPAVARRADRVIAISQSAAEDIERTLRVPATRIDVTLLGHRRATAAGGLSASETRQRFRLATGPIVLMVGTRKPHKNVARLIEAMSDVLAARPDAQLVLAGHPAVDEDALVTRAEQLGVGARIAFLGFVQPEELEGLYAAASCFVLPSTHEGFGLPVLEAMGRGVPVACSNIAVLAEVAADAAHLFDPGQPREIAAAIVEVLSDPVLAQRLVAAGHRREASLTWAATAEQTLASYERGWRERGPA